MTKFNELAHHTPSEDELEVDATELVNYIGYYIISNRPWLGLNYSKIVSVCMKALRDEEWTLVEASQHSRWGDNETEPVSFSFAAETRVVIVPETPQHTKGKP